MKKIILIGGSPTSGKTTLAMNLSKELNMPWLSTDFVRDWMRTIVRKEDYPDLFLCYPTNDKDMTAESYLNSRDEKQIVKEQNDESVDIWKAIKSFIEFNNMWDDGYIIEGVGIIPELVKEISDNPEIKPLFIINHDEERIRKVVFTRGLWDDAKTYPDSVKEKEVSWVLEYNKWLEVEVEKYGFQKLQTSTADELKEKALKQINI